MPERAKSTLLHAYIHPFRTLRKPGESAVRVLLCSTLNHALSYTFIYTSIKQILSTAPNPAATPPSSL